MYTGKCKALLRPCIAGMATGLSGEYSWAVSLLAPGGSARIEAAPPPAPPTVEELARAVAHEAEQVAADDDY
eukprot:COSAG06_NODE_144_length_22239_cov_2220.906549_13_plen_72_part_00